MKSPTASAFPASVSALSKKQVGAASEAFDELVTPPQTPVVRAVDADLELKKGAVSHMPFERPFYEMIVDGIHSHPNSVRVGFDLVIVSYPVLTLSWSSSRTQPSLRDAF